VGVDKSRGGANSQHLCIGYSNNYSKTWEKNEGAVPP
jgi:hypothetical protein